MDAKNVISGRRTRAGQKEDKVEALADTFVSATTMHDAIARGAIASIAPFTRYTHDHRAHTTARKLSAVPYNYNCNYGCPNNNNNNNNNTTTSNEGYALRAVHTSMRDKIDEREDVKLAVLYEGRTIQEALGRVRKVVEDNHDVIVVAGIPFNQRNQYFGMEEGWWRAASEEPPTPPPLLHLGWGSKWNQMVLELGTTTPSNAAQEQWQAEKVAEEHAAQFEALDRIDASVVRVP